MSPPEENSTRTDAGTMMGAEPTTGKEAEQHQQQQQQEEEEPASFERTSGSTAVTEPIDEPIDGSTTCTTSTSGIAAHNNTSPQESSSPSQGTGPLSPSLRPVTQRRFSGTLSDTHRHSDCSDSGGGAEDTKIDRKSNGNSGSNVFAKMQRRLSNDGSGSFRRMSARESDAADSWDDGMASRRSSDAASSLRRRSSAMLFSWGRMAKKDDIWGSVSDLAEHEDDFREDLKYNAKSCTREIKRIVVTAVTTPSILAATLITLAVLLTAGLVTINALAKAYSDQRRGDAIDTANELGQWMSNQLDEALLPLFAMSQFVKHLDTFKKLPLEIGLYGAPGSAPPLLGKEGSHRNVTNICDNPETFDVFDEIAANVKKDAGMEGVLVGVQLAPQAVVCLIHPLINTEDFADGQVLDNRGIVGHDLLTDPDRVFIARATIPADGVVMAGPLTLKQGGTNTPIVKEAFIARLAINIPGYSINLDGVDYSCWGFAVILLNWAALKEKSGIDEMFRREGLEYRLTRTDVKIDSLTGESFEEVKSIANSERSDVLQEDNSVSVDLDTTNNIWKMSVGYPDGFAAPWLKGLTALVVILSVCISGLLMTILVAKKDMKKLLYKMMPPVVVKKLRRGETVVQRYDLATVFFSDIVGFTKLSGEMSPLDVMDLLNEMYTQFDELVVKHNVYKVETIGDAYIVIGGGPDNCLGRMGAEKVALFALDAMEVCQTLKANNGARICIRAGLASGQVVAGVVGKTMPKFTLFGDTVNFASRMESTSSKMRIQCSDMTYRLLCNAENYDFDLEKRIDASSGEAGVHAKGKGHVISWWINSAFPRIRGAIEDSLKAPPPTPYEDDMDEDIDLMERAENDDNDLNNDQENSEAGHRKSITFEDKVSS